MKRYVLVISIFLVSCTQNSFKIESKFENNNPKIIYKELKDTLINSKLSKQIYKIEFNKNGDTIRKGVFINEMPFDKHTFYKNKLVNCIKNYIIPNSFFIELDELNQTLNLKQYRLDSDSSYLNTILYLDEKEEIISHLSDYYNAKFEKQTYSINDTVSLNLEFFSLNYKVVNLQMYFIVPEDNDKVTVVNFDNSNKYDFKRKILDKNHNTIKGMIKIISYDISKDSNDINSYSERVLFIDEKFKVN